MTTTTFDTLAYSKTLREAGFTEQQADAQATALATVLKDSVNNLVTKDDIARLEERTEGRFRLLQWMLGFNLAISIALLWILIRTATH
jgi:hypothetical protein